MPDKLLLVDIGNTCIKIGFSSPKAIGNTYSLPSRARHTADSLGLDMLSMLRLEELEPGDILDGVVCSVAPDLDALFRQACERFLKFTPRSFPADFTLDLENRYDRPQEVGADRLLAAFATRRLYPEPPSLISVDFGTATTFDCVRGNAYLGGLICPGLLSSHGALADHTAKLPRISLEVKENAPLIGRSTAMSMSHGFIFGFAAMTEGLCLRLKEQLPAPTLVIGTGGFAADVARVCAAFNHVRPDLILEGLRLAWNEHA